nr:hypothetical protein [Tanacetum cinerariifolium]
VQVGTVVITLEMVGTVVLTLEMEALLLSDLELLFKRLYLAYICKR